MSDSEQYSNRLELDLISLLVNFSCAFLRFFHYKFLGRAELENNTSYDHYPVTGKNSGTVRSALAVKSYHQETLAAEEKKTRKK